MLGKSKRIRVEKENTTIIDGGGQKDGIQGRCTQIRQQIKEATSDYDREKLQEHLAKLAGVSPVIRVGGWRQSWSAQKLLRPTAKADWGREFPTGIAGRGGAAPRAHRAGRQLSGLESSVRGAPPQQDADCDSGIARATRDTRRLQKPGAFLWRYVKFESISLQQRVSCELCKAAVRPIEETEGSNPSPSESERLRQARYPQITPRGQVKGQAEP